MQNLHYGLIMLLMLMGPVSSAKAQVSIGIGLPSVSIGINLPAFPELVPVPGYPVYYAPQMNSNYFFYDGMYWVYEDDNWYASSWYNGPWGMVQPEVIPLFILRIPVRYYRQPPVFFRGWQSTAPPRWGQHWGRGWEQQRSGWDKWKRGSTPTRAPLPVYQRQYAGDRYPHAEQQQSLRSQQYRYQPRDKAVQQHFKQIEQKRAPAPAPRQQQQKPQVDQRQQRDQQQQKQQIDQRQQRDQQQQKQQVDQRQQREQQQQKQQIDQRQQREQQQAPRAQEREQRSQDRGASQEPGRERGQGQGRDDERGRGHDK